MFPILTYALQSLLRRWQKQVSLLLIYAFVVAFYASIIFFTSSLRQETNLVLADTPSLWVQKLAGGRLVSSPKSMIDSLQNIRGVQKVVPRIWGYNFDSPTGAVFTVLGSDSLLQGLEMLETSHSGKLKDNMVICGTGFLELRNLALGEQLTLLNDRNEILDFEIVGSFTANSDLLTRDLVVLSPKSAQNILGLAPEEVTDISLYVYNEDEIENIARKIDRRFSGIRVVTSQELQTTYQTLFAWRGGIFVYGTIIAVFAFLILAWERAGSLRGEDRKEIGILKAVGWQISDVLFMKFWEAFLISLTATLMGSVLAYVHVFWFNAPLLRPFLIGWSVLYPSYQLIPFIDLGNILVIFSLSVIPYLSATLIPAWRGAITDPSEVIRG